jgi:hypothetical protein
MTPKEIDRIECAIRHIESSLDVDPWAAEIAVDAMEKQIPQKPKMPLDAYWVCPTCKLKIDYPFEHCRRCGQAIDWTEGE